MTPKAITENTLFYGDNLNVLREHIADESVDLIYLDPPFNSSRSYNVLFRDESGTDSEAQITAFEDTWHWGPTAERTYDELATYAPERVGAAIAALRQLVGSNQMMAYLVMMAARLVELHRALKPTGSLWLHCDPTASHYLKIILDTIFGPEHFLGEVAWKRTTAHSGAKKPAPVHDILLYYSKSNAYVWSDLRTEYEPEYLERYYKYDDGDGRLYWRDNLCADGIRKGRSGLPWHGIDPTEKGMHWKYTIEKLDELDAQGRIYWPPKGGMPQYKRYRDELKGKALSDIWDDINRINPVGSERLGYPTQKPVALLERIIAASSNPGDIVLDPFAGCGTAMAAAQKLGRKWIGIDITHLSVSLLKYRMKDMFELEPRKDYTVIGEPEDLAGARQLASENRYQFQWWATSLVEMQPVGGQEGGAASSGRKQGKKGSDKGIDGVIPFVEVGGKRERVIGQVKSGHVSAGDIRDLRGVVERENAAIGVFITLEKPSRDMISEAASAGFYESPGWGKKYPKIQILTIEDLLAGKRIEAPPVHGTFKQAERVRESEGEQGRMF